MLFDEVILSGVWCTVRFLEFEMNLVGGLFWLGSLAREEQSHSIERYGGIKGDDTRVVIGDGLAVRPTRHRL